MTTGGNHGVLLSLPQMEVLIQADAYMVRLQQELAAAEAAARRCRERMKAARALGQRPGTDVDALVDAHVRLKAAQQQLVQHQHYFQQIVNMIHADHSLVAQQLGHELSAAASNLLAPGKQG